MDYKKDGFNPSLVKDRLFYLDPKTGEYEELSLKVYTTIVTGQIRIWQKLYGVNCLGLFVLMSVDFLCESIYDMSSLYAVSH